MPPTSPSAAFITTPEALAQALDIPVEPLRAVHAVYPLRISSYYLNLIRQHGLPLWKQAVPDLLELSDDVGLTDPLNEENLSPVPCLTINIRTEPYCWSAISAPCTAGSAPANARLVNRG